MKGNLYGLDGNKKKEIEMPSFFDEKIRKDIAEKYFEVNKFKHPVSPNSKAGKQHSASGTISHKRHDWKGHYGRGISRIPRKTMWRRGTQFMWVGAEVSSTRGGRRAHPPKGIGKEKKINKKEIQIAFNSGFAATGIEKFVLKRYESLDELKIKIPVIVESKITSSKTKDLISMFKKIYGINFDLVIKKKSVRAGKGKLRGRKYKSNAGLLLIKSENENIKMTGIEIKNVGDVTMNDLYPLGRLCAYTEKSLEELKR